MSLLSKNVYIDKKLDGTVYNYNNIYQSSIKMKSADIKLSTCIDFNKENNKIKILNSKLVILLEYQNIFAKAYPPNWPEKVLVNEKIKSTELRPCVINDLNCKQIVEIFHKKEFRIEKAIKKKRKLYGKDKII